ncbi:MAG: transporter substrate-binding protein [Acidimicrobiia bacterium]|nr:transporter substrate-binding protein [Acidimicrobiia bacterium]
MSIEARPDTTRPRSPSRRNQRCSSLTVVTGALCAIALLGAACSDAGDEPAATPPPAPAPAAAEPEPPPPPPAEPEAAPQPAADPEPAPPAPEPPPAPAEPASGEPIMVGSILDETGPLNIYGTPMVDATRLAVDHINATGGVLGRPLELVEVDSKSDQNEYINGAERLASMDLAVVHGGITSASREAIRPVFDDAEMLYFYNVLYEGGVCDINTFITGTVPTQQVEPLLRWATENIGPKVYVVAADYNYGQISADWAETYAPSVGAEILATDFFPLDVSEFGTTLSAIQDADPDVIFSFLVGGAHISFYSQFAASGLADEMTIVSTTFGLGNEHIALEPAAQENLYVAYSYFQELDTPENTAFVAAWQDAYGGDYPYITDLAVDTWDGWHMWAEATERAGTTDREAVIAELQKGANFVSPRGLVVMDGAAHHVTVPIRIAVTDGANGFDVISTYESVGPEFEQQQCDLVNDPDVNEQFTP